MRKILSFMLIFLIVIFGRACADLEIRFIDVGQGDATLITCDGESLLIDGGPVSASEKIYTSLQNSPLRASLDFIIATHPHEDHVGGLSAALNAMPVDLILSPVLKWDSAPFNSMLKYAGFQGTPIVVPADGDQIRVGSAVVTILHCWPEAWDENDMSIICRIEYGDFSAIFTGDAETMAEYMVIDSGREIKSTLLKVGHHGSDSSTSAEFLRAVSPTYAVISCGVNNEYGHPHQEVLNLLKNANVNVYRTDLQGTIVFRVDENGNVRITTDRIAENKSIFTSPASLCGPTRNVIGYYVLNTNSKKFHLPDCDAAKDISNKNRKVYTGSREVLIENGYTPCRHCNP